MKPSNIKALETGSGISWDEWLEFLKEHNNLDHAEMAKVVLSKINEVGQSTSPEWWAQGVTVAYEQYIGRRKVGERSDGSFSVTVSKTIPNSMDEALERWDSNAKRSPEIQKIIESNTVRISRTDKWRYWRAKGRDGSSISVNIQSKPGSSKSSLAINHDKLSSHKDLEKWRDFWKSFTLGK